MPHRVRLGKAAIADLKAIGDWIAERAGDDTAEAYVRRIDARCQSLSEYPLRGAARDALGPGVRSIAFEGRATILYRAAADEVLILRIFHAGRDVERGFQS